MRILRQLLFITLCLTTINSSAQIWFDSLEQAQLHAKQENKLLLIDFYADWCGPCKQLDMDVWNNEKIKPLLKNFVLVKINIDYNRSDASSYGVKGIPYVAFATPWDDVLHQFVGYRDLNQVKPILERYPSDMGEIYTSIKSFKKNEGFSQSLATATAFQNKAVFCKRMGVNDFIKQSSMYLAKAKRKASNSDAQNIERIELMRILNSSILGQHKKVIKYFTKKKKLDQIQAENKAIALCALCNSYSHTNQKEKYNTLKVEIQNNTTHFSFLEKLVAME